MRSPDNYLYEDDLNASLVVGQVLELVPGHYCAKTLKEYFKHSHDRHQLLVQAINFLF